MAMYVDTYSPPKKHIRFGSFYPKQKLQSINKYGFFFFLANSNSIEFLLDNFFSAGRNQPLRTWFYLVRRKGFKLILNHEVGRPQILFFQIFSIFFWAIA